MRNLFKLSIFIPAICAGLSTAAFGASSLATNQTLTSGQQLTNGSYRLTMQSDGNLVMYTSANKAVWASNTVGTGANQLVLGSTNNGWLALYKNSTVVKALYGTPPASVTYALVVNNGSGSGSNYAPGQVVPITANAAPSGKVFNHWVADFGNPVIANINAQSTSLTMPSSNATVTATYKTAPAGSNSLSTNGTLYTDQQLTSSNGQYRLSLQSDGNLVLRNASSTALWSMGTNGKGGVKLILQGDGNLVLYTASNTAVWSSNTVGMGATVLKLNDDGSLVLLAGSSVVWSVNGSGGGGTAANATSLNGKIMAGYQGWHMTQGDGANVGWRHWASSTPNASNISFDLWPDLREYGSSELTATSFKYSNGSTAGLYSAFNSTTVERHVKWMKDYGIDGVFVQRFIGEAVNMRSVRDKVLQNIRYGSEKHGRVFANMWDISGGNSSTLVSNIKNDWMHLVDDLKITESSQYQRHEGRPVICIWGFGTEGRPGSTSDAANLIKWFKSGAAEKYRATVMLGVNDNWRGSSWESVFKTADIISPWAVGRYGDNSGADNFKNNKIVPDLSRLSGTGVDYMPVVFPGFSWWNLKDGSSPLNKIPRNGGKFFWRQFYNAISAGCNMVYVAMYDEVDEGTAIYKVAENSSQIPTTGKFVTLNADGVNLPSNWYLRLTGEATKMLRKEIGLTSSIPIVP